MSIDELQALITTLLFDPVAGKVIASGLSLLFVLILVKYAQRALGRYVDDAQRRYRLRKLSTFFGYMLAILLLSIVFSDRLGGLTVLLGIIGAGVALNSSQGRIQLGSPSFELVALPDLNINISDKRS